MKLIFRQRLFSWFDSYDIYDETEKTIYSVEGQLSFGHCLHIHDAQGAHIATVKQRVFTFFPEFELYEGETCVGSVVKEFSLFKPRFSVDCRGWRVEGDFMEWDYEILGSAGRVALISKELFRLTDTYVIDVADPANALYALMVVLAIDAEKCSRN